MTGQGNRKRNRSQHWILVGTLGLGNLLVWGDRLVSAALPVAFDFASFEKEVRRTFAGTELRNRPFVANRMIPETHLHLRTKGDDDPLYSIYLGHYPRLGVLETEPHDPRVCYQATGYRVVAGPTAVLVEGDGQRHAINRVEVSRSSLDGEKLELTTYYWHQLAGHMPAAETGMPGPLVQARIRYLEGRSDLVWVRVELRGRGSDLDPVLRDRLLALMRAAATAMGRRP